MDVIEGTALRHLQLKERKRIFPIQCSASGIWKLGKEPIVTPSDVCLLLLILRSLEMTFSSGESNLDRIPMQVSEENTEEVFVCNRVSRAILFSLLCGCIPQMSLGTLFTDSSDLNPHSVAIQLLRNVLGLSEKSQSVCLQDITVESTSASSSSSSMVPKTVNWTMVTRGCQFVVCLTTFANTPEIFFEFLKTKSTPNPDYLRALLRDCMTTIFEDIEPSRRAVLSVIFRGAIRYSELLAHQTSASISSKTSVAKFNSLSFCSKLYVETLSCWSKQLPNVLLEIAHIIVGFVPVVALLQSSDVQSILLPIISICNGDMQLFGSLLSSSRKLLLQSDHSRKVLGISHLCYLLSSVNESWQRESIQAILHSFSLPLSCRRVLYTQLLEVCQSSEASAFAGKFQPCRDVKVILHARLLVSVENLFSVQQVIDRSTPSLKAKSAKFLCYHKCVEIFRSVSGDKSFLSEDIIGLMQLGWLLEVQLYPEVTKQVIMYITSKIMRSSMKSDQENIFSGTNVDKSSFSSCLISLIDTIEAGFPVSAVDDKEIKVDLKSHLVCCFGVVKSVINCLVPYTSLLNVSESVVVLQSILDCLLQISITTGCSDNFSSLEKVYISSLSGSHNLQLPIQAEAACCKEPYPSNRMLTTIMNIFHSQHSTHSEISEVLEDSDSMYIPLSSVFGSMSQIAIEIKNSAPISTATSSDLFNCLHSLRVMYIEAGAVEKEQKFLERAEDLAVSIALYQLQRDPSYCRDHFTDQRKASIFSESTKRSVYNEDSDEDFDSEDGISDEHDDDKMSTCTTIKDFVSNFEANKSIKTSFQPICNLLGSFVNRLPSHLSKRLEKWDFLEVEQFRQLSVEKSLKFKVNKFFRKVQAAARNSIRYSIFGLRNDVLNAIRVCLICIQQNSLPENIGI